MDTYQKEYLAALEELINAKERLLGQSYMKSQSNSLKRAGIEGEIRAYADVLTALPAVLS